MSDLAFGMSTLRIIHWELLAMQLYLPYIEGWLFALVLQV